MQINQRPVQSSTPNKKTQPLTFFAEMLQSLITQASNQQLVLGCLLLPLYLLLRLLGNPVPIIQGWYSHESTLKTDGTDGASPAVASQLLAYVIVGVSGYVATNALIPNIKQYTLRKGISGKDLGKKGTAMAEKDV